jgi:hypothetical protein
VTTVSDPRDYGRRVTITCQGRALVDGECVGEICGRTLTAPQTWVLDRARAAGWRVGKRADGTPDAMCDRCAKPDPALVKLLRSLT